MNRRVWITTAKGAALGVAGCAVLFLTSDRRTLANDWFLAVTLVLANASGFALAARYGINLFWVALAGLAGMGVGGWVGVHTIGSFEYTVPTPQEDRVLRIITPGAEREIALTGVPERSVRRVPVGGGLGMLVGWAVGLGICVKLQRTRDRGVEDPVDEQTL